MSKIYFDANQISEMLDISKTRAYNIIKKLNDELEKRGLLWFREKSAKYILMNAGMVVQKTWKWMLLHRELFRFPDFTKGQ